MARAKISDLRKRIAELEMELRACSATVAALWKQNLEPNAYHGTLSDIGQRAVEEWDAMKAELVKLKKRKRRVS